MSNWRQVSLPGAVARVTTTKDESTGVAAGDTMALGDLCPVISSGPSWAAKDESTVPSEGALTVLKITNTRPDGSIDLSELAYVTGLPARTKVIGPTSLVMIRTNGNRKRIGNVYVPSEELHGAAVSAFQFVLDAHDAETRDYLYMVLRSPRIQHLMSESASGSTGLGNLAVRWLKTLKIPWPDSQERKYQVEVFGAIDDQITALDKETESLDALLRGRKEELFAHYAATGNMLPIGHVLEEVKRPITVDPEAEYRQIGIRSHGRGLFTKEAVTGKSLGSKRVFWVEPGDLVINIVFAWEGAVAIVPPEIEGYCGSHRFPCYRRLDGGDIEFFRLFFSTKTGTQLLANCSPGGAGRNRTLSRKRLMESPVGMPPAHEQERAISELQALEANVLALRTEADRLRAVHATLLSGLLDRSIDIKFPDLEV
jgi:type I restriction enzyme S subunit